MLANNTFRSDEVADLMNRVYTRFHIKSNSTRIDEQELQYAFYTGDKYQIEKILKEDLAGYYDTDSKIVNILHSWLNITKKIINAISVIYKEPAKRSVLVDGKVDVELTKYYNSILPPSVNSIDKRANRLATLQGGSISLFHFDKEKKAFTQKVNSGHFYNVITSVEDSHRLDGLSYFKEIQNLDDPETIEVIWTDNEYYIVTYDGQVRPFGANDTTENLYRKIPACTFSDKQHESFWSEGANDIIQANREINALLVKLTYDDLILGTAGHLFGTNLDNLTSLGVKQRTSSGGVSSREASTDQLEETASTLKGGRQNVILARGSRQGNQTPDLKYVSTNPQVAEVFETISNKLKMVATTRGLNPDIFADMVKSGSGFSKILDRLELMEIRQEDMDTARQYERDRFDIIRTMNNTHYNLKEVDVAIPENAEIRVDFGEIKMPKTTAEEWMEIENKIKYNIINPIDVLRKHNPDIKTDEEAQEILDKNAELNEPYQELKPVVSQNGLDDPTNNANINNKGETPDV